MARQSFASSLKHDQREELNKRLRGSQYTGSIAIAKWLQEEGCKASKSAVHRYAAALREVDGLGEMNSVQIAVRTPVDTDGLNRKEQILIEIGNLRVRENQLIEELRDLRD